MHCIHNSRISIETHQPTLKYKQRVLWAEMDGRQLLCYARPNNTYRHTTTTTTHASSGPQGGGLRLALPVLRLPLKVRPQPHACLHIRFQSLLPLDLPSLLSPYPLLI